jgi:hypothetical protein
MFLVRYLVTVFDASITLYAWFAENDTFEISQVSRATVGSENKKESKKELEASFRCALNQLEKMELISRADLGDSEVWVLQKDYLTVDQDLKISADTALAISEVLNKFCQIIDDYKDECNPVSIKEKDIQNLIHICSYFMSKN